MAITHRQLWMFLTGRSVSDDVRVRIAAELDREDSFASRVIADLDERSDALDRGRIDLVDLLDGNGDQKLKPSPLQALVLAVHHNQNQWSPALFASLAQVALFWLFWGAVLSHYLGWAFGAIYCGLECVVAGISSVRSAQNTRGSIFEAIVAGVHLGALGLVPALIRGQPISAGISIFAVAAAFFGSRIGLATGLGLKKRMASDGLTWLGVTYETAVWGFVNAAPIFCAFGFVTILVLILGFRGFGSYDSQYLIEWAALVTGLSATARCVLAQPIRCTFAELMGPVMTGALGAVLFYLLICYVLQDRVDALLILGSALLGASFDSRIAVIHGFSAWREEKTKMMGEFVAWAITMGCMLAFGAMASWTGSAIARYVSWYDTGLNELVVVLASVVGFLIGMLRLYRFVLPRTYQVLFGASTSNREAFGRAVESAMSIPQTLVVGMAQSLWDMAQLYRAIIGGRWTTAYPGLQI